MPYFTVTYPATLSFTVEADSPEDAIAQAETRAYTLSEDDCADGAYVQKVYGAAPTTAIDEYRTERNTELADDGE